MCILLKQLCQILYGTRLSRDTANRFQDSQDWNSHQLAFVAHHIHLCF